MSNFKKYLARYAEQDVSKLATFPALTFQHVIIIPAYKESSRFIRQFLSSNLAKQNVLVITVINQPFTDCDKKPQQQLATDILALGEMCWQHDNLTLVGLENSNSACLVVDHYTYGLDANQGVGLARKIGCDIACQLIAQQHLLCQWLHSTDADATLPEHYFLSLEQHLSSLNATLQKNAVAACYEFSHVSDDIVLHQANQRYELALRYYVAGLRYAKSHYAFFTIGSILAFKADAYAGVRGCPKKSAGEDFYLLNKLAKLGDVLYLADCQITLAARTSDRVPFGTGPAVKQILALEQNQQQYCYYHPQLFEQLKGVIEGFDCLFDYRYQLMHWYQKLDKQNVAALQSLGFEQFIAKQANSGKKQFNNQLNVWFDAFKTLKFIHYLRDNYCSDIALEQALMQASFFNTAKYG